MCGLVGYVDLRDEPRTPPDVLRRMTDTLVHRGPDAEGYYTESGVGFGFRRLSIIDPAGGDQPIFNEDQSLVLVCNGEIYNYRELRTALEGRRHRFRTETDVEALVHLYEEKGADLLQMINGQFAFAIYDKKEKSLLLARDHFGVNPLYYTVTEDLFIFASEIKAILEHPLAPREIDLTGLDQILTFPGLISPRTIFKGIESLKSGHYIIVKNGQVRVGEYWDLIYPQQGEIDYDKPEKYYVETLRDLFEQSVKYRLQADAPVGFYLSGGLDSSLTAAMIRRVSPEVRRRSFSIGFTEREISETRYQRLVADHVDSQHHEIVFDWAEIAARLPAMIYHCESPVKESFNTCSLALSEAAHRAGVKVVLAGEGADELFAGYPGYRFDRLRLRDQANPTAGNASADLETLLEEEIRERLWGDGRLFYETNLYPLREIKTALYSEGVNELFDEFECVNFPLINQERLRNRHFIHQRSYMDFKLRLSDHLLSEHGDRMVMANSVEGRYPFLDIDLVKFAEKIPPDLKLNGYSEKYVLKKVAAGLAPAEIIEREKFGFRAPGSPYLLRQGIELVEDMLSSERIARQGYFNPDTVERLRLHYSRQGSRLHPHFESDLLMIVLTFNLLLDAFGLPNFQ